MDIYTNAVNKIVHKQESIIGPFALDQARKISGLTVESTGNVSISGDPKQILDNLVHVYSDFFGLASVEVCKEAIREIKKQIPAQNLPDILK